jgi:hypothetical protein
MRGSIAPFTLLVGFWYVVGLAAVSAVGPIYAGSAFTFVRLLGWVMVLVGHWTMKDWATTDVTAPEQNTDSNRALRAPLLDIQFLLDTGPLVAAFQRRTDYPSIRAKDRRSRKRHVCSRARTIAPQGTFFPDKAFLITCSIAQCASRRSWNDHLHAGINRYRADHARRLSTSAEQSAWLSWNETCEDIYIAILPRPRHPFVSADQRPESVLNCSVRLATATPVGG